MSDKTYNGWTNYATWRVNLEIFDGANIEDMFGEKEIGVDDLVDYLQQWAEEIIENDTGNGGLARDYALAFLSDVNWREIAKHMIDDYAEQD